MPEIKALHTTRSLLHISSNRFAKVNALMVIRGYGGGEVVVGLTPKGRIPPSEGGFMTDIPDCGWRDVEDGDGDEVYDDEDGGVVLDKGRKEGVDANGDGRLVVKQSTEMSLVDFHDIMNRYEHPSEKAAELTLVSMMKIPLQYKASKEPAFLGWEN
ncbi:hypothetical protein NE237_000913 [Protea cynaroides]|uniref:Uncharacterized protein n=1 Tax=Protea cynaroides TaxID=273540 RepID=A0A9Q0QXX6_9MAGN|nr:hypothetical protein NE237_000913 [Protea cynaroides]